MKKSKSKKYKPINNEQNSFVISPEILNLLSPQEIMCLNKQFRYLSELQISKLVTEGVECIKAFLNANPNEKIELDIFIDNFTKSFHQLVILGELTSTPFEDLKQLETTRWGEYRFLTEKSKESICNASKEDLVKWKANALSLLKFGLEFTKEEDINLLNWDVLITLKIYLATFQSLLENRFLNSKQIFKLSLQGASCVMKFLNVAKKYIYKTSADKTEICADKIINTIIQDNPLLEINLNGLSSLTKIPIKELKLKNEEELFYLKTQKLNEITKNFNIPDKKANSFSWEQLCLLQDNNPYLKILSGDQICFILEPTEGTENLSKFLELSHELIQKLTPTELNKLIVNFTELSAVLTAPQISTLLSQGIASIENFCEINPTTKYKQLDTAVFEQLIENYDKLLSNGVNAAAIFSVAIFEKKSGLDILLELNAGIKSKNLPQPSLDYLPTVLVKLIKIPLSATQILELCENETTFWPLILSCEGRNKIPSESFKEYFTIEKMHELACREAGGSILNMVVQYGPALMESAHYFTGAQIEEIATSGVDGGLKIEMLYKNLRRLSDRSSAHITEMYSTKDIGSIAMRGTTLSKTSGTTSNAAPVANLSKYLYYPDDIIPFYAPSYIAATNYGLYTVNQSPDNPLLMIANNGHLPSPYPQEYNYPPVAQHSASYNNNSHLASQYFPAAYSNPVNHLQADSFPVSHKRNIEYPGSLFGHKFRKIITESSTRVLGSDLRQPFYADADNELTNLYENIFKKDDIKVHQHNEHEILDNPDKNENNLSILDLKKPTQKTLVVDDCLDFLEKFLEKNNNDGDDSYDDLRRYSMESP